MSQFVPDEPVARFLAEHVFFLKDLCCGIGQPFGLAGLFIAIDSRPSLGGGD